MHYTFFKDKSLDELARVINVAQFVSFAPGLATQQRYSRVIGHAPNYIFGSVEFAVSALMAASPERSLNVRSFREDDPKSNEFLYGLKNESEIVSAVRRISAAGFYVIINETIDVRDGGVSGVVQGGVIEFSPDDTPRCVEKPGVVSIPFAWGKELLQTVYGFPIDLDFGPNRRLEFSLHPAPRGWKASHTLGWELEEVGDSVGTPSLQWPNNFSRLIGDKAYGLLLGSIAGLPVPRSTVISRRIAPFTFGNATGAFEKWLRTCPREQVPGKFTTHRGWIDPFAAVNSEDPDGNQLSSLIAQDGVTPCYSGALIVASDGAVVIEGRAGEGEILMRGQAVHEELPIQVKGAVRELYERAHAKFGPVRLEWVYDGKVAWLVQLHRGSTTSQNNVLVPGVPEQWIPFDVTRGLEDLRSELRALTDRQGLLLKGSVGLTSHVADIVRKAKKPARIDAS